MIFYSLCPKSPTKVRVNEDCLKGTPDSEAVPKPSWVLPDFLNGRTRPRVIRMLFPGVLSSHRVRGGSL